MLAKLHERAMEKGKDKFQKPQQTTKLQTSTTKQTTPTSTLWRERQKRDYCKANGMCYWCSDKYDPAHAAICPKRPKAQVNALSLNSLDVELSEHILAQLDLKDALAQDFCQLSLNALAGTDQGQAMKVSALVGNKAMLILIDSGSSHSFVSSNFLQTVGIVPVPCAPQQVQLASGATLITDTMVPELKWWSNGHM